MLSLYWLLLLALLRKLLLNLSLQGQGLCVLSRASVFQPRRPSSHLPLTPS